ncbi:acyl-CoA dehydrogenase family protein [Candidatus Aminicenantes bacterium AC-335-A11]|jgi:glutaryl-CoA dehydrogenase|nr:acyl-CoA dehydrogenase family protein [SCandidatus Aminicenantes bacterium Aminicenantia_JdfR_composite]MCP2606067.1 acyl-CoA dehydrogenase family protein [Candidatus Aminicenantes bacterium AC-708-I09]MCP2619096.1 acyl-CoA dehydrogenase family protein [Candidatus Aminicenantes bacterium AC-335-A11]
MTKDLIYFEELLTDEEIMVRDSVRKFVKEKVIPIINEYHRKAEFPSHLIKDMAELGLFGAYLKGYGCAEINNVAYGLALQELEYGDSALRSFCSVQSSLVMWPILEYGSEEQKKYWLPKMAKGEKIGCYGLTEPDYGSDPGSMITKAKKEGRNWRINGRKMWITNGSIADVALVWAKTDEGIRGFLVEKGTPGYTVQDIKGKFSLRASITSELIFEDCIVPEDNVLPKAKGLKAPLSCLTQARYGIGWGAIGAALACYETALEYSKTRIQFGKPIASFQLVQNKLVWMLNEIIKGQLLALRTGRLKDKGKASYVLISMLKRNNVEIALEIARMARDILGASGITDEYPVIRHMMNLESVKTYEGTHDIHTLIIGEAITGIEAFR